MCSRQSDTVDSVIGSPVRYNLTIEFHDTLNGEELGVTDVQSLNKERKSP